MWAAKPQTPNLEQSIKRGKLVVLRDDGTFEFVEKSETKSDRKEPPEKQVRRLKRNLRVGVFRSGSHVYLPKSEEEQESDNLERQARPADKSRIDAVLLRNDNPGPGRYNIAGNILKKSLNAKAAKPYVRLPRLPELSSSQPMLLPGLKQGQAFPGRASCSSKARWNMPSCA